MLSTHRPFAIEATQRLGDHRKSMRASVYLVPSILRRTEATDELMSVLEACQLLVCVCVPVSRIDLPPRHVYSITKAADRFYLRHLYNNNNNNNNNNNKLEGLAKHKPPARLVLPSGE